MARKHHTIPVAGGAPTPILTFPGVPPTGGAEATDRGLGTAFGSAVPLPVGVVGTEDQQWIVQLDPNLIDVPELYLRQHVDPVALQELVAAIAAERRILQPIRVAPHETEIGRYHLIDGQRRTLAARELGIRVPAILVTDDSTQGTLQRLYQQIALNSNRAEESVIDRGRFYLQLLRGVERHGLEVLGPGAPAAEGATATQAMAGRLGISPATAYLLVAIGETVIQLEAQGEGELVARLTANPEVTLRSLRDAFRGNTTTGARMAALRTLDRELGEAATPPVRRARRPRGGFAGIAVTTSARGRVVVQARWTLADVAKDPERFRHLAMTGVDRLRQEVEAAYRAALQAAGVEASSEGRGAASEGDAGDSGELSLARQAMQAAQGRLAAQQLPPPPAFAPLTAET